MAVFMHVSIVVRPEDEEHSRFESALAPLTHI